MTERFRPNGPETRSGPVPKVEITSDSQIRIDQNAIASFLKMGGATPEEIDGTRLVLEKSDKPFHFLQDGGTLVVRYSTTANGYATELNHLLYGSLGEFQEGKSRIRSKKSRTQLTGAGIASAATLDAVAMMNDSINSPGLPVTVVATIAAGVGGAYGYRYGRQWIDNAKTKRIIESGKKLMEENGNVSFVYPRIGEDTREKGITFDDLGGLEEVKEKLEEVALAFTRPDLRRKYDVERPTGLLLYGEPGVGKTRLAHAFANRIGAEILDVKSSETIKKWVGDSAKEVAAIFDKAKRAKSPLVVLINEFDSSISIASNPEHGDHEYNSAAAVFKQQMDSLDVSNPNVIVIATTNVPEEIDESIRRRFNYDIYVPMPDDDARRDIVFKQIEKIMGTVDSSDLDGPIPESFEEFPSSKETLDAMEIAAETDGMSGAQIVEIFRRLKSKRLAQEARGQEPTLIIQEEVLLEIQKFRTNG